MENAKAECCPRCHGTRMTNLVYVCTGKETCVYVKCADCGSYVARYVLARYTSDRGYESLLANLRGYAHRSGKRCLEQIEEFGAMVEAEFERVQKLAVEKPQEQRVEEMICEAQEDASDKKPTDA